MTPTAQAIPLLDDLAVVQPHLQAHLAGYFGRPRAIRRLDRRACPYASSFRLDEIDVQFDDGSRLYLVLKDLGRDGMMEEARQARPQFLYAPQREIDAYRWILPHAPAGAPAWYGAMTQSVAERHWLLLERVRGWLLWQIGDVTCWETTAAWIARFHGAFSATQAAQLGKRANILVYDEAFYWRWMERAQRFAERDREKRRIVDRIAKKYGPIVDRLTKMPRTLIHGEFYPSNIIVNERPPVRVCPVDWEMAALGPGLIDLATLTAGWVAPVQRALTQAYLAAASNGDHASDPPTCQARARHVPGTNLAPPVRVPRGFTRDLDCCRLHLAIRMLGWSDTWHAPAVHARNWLADAAAIADRVQR